jgi:hypothetical protein
MRAYILLYRSSSMAGKWAETLTAINGYVAELAQTRPALAITLTALAIPATACGKHPSLRSSATVCAWTAGSR